MNKLYTPVQVGIGTYIGGPFAAMYFLKGNFDVLDKPELSKKVIVVGIAFSIVLFAALPFIPESLPNNVIPIMYLVPVLLMMKNHHLTKKEILESELYDFHSSWKVLGVSLLWMILFFIIAIGVMLGLEGMGLITIA
ncbi:hypothetical protein UA32_16370 [Photobacterium angustum]|uniref:Uncharacterized protein n=1 Tax=Photobacterium angustum TaxID=661 RepID=A0ABX5H8P2_PHOAN|nr:hypothetical protein [Photobacterium angustum]KJG36576.1 hypothetical protein UA32_16370 [Photobacterium angustum]PSX12390.1 hypothetical protein C0W27_04170 [Photobacterium angustum]